MEIDTQWAVYCLKEARQLSSSGQSLQDRASHGVGLSFALISELLGYVYLLVA